MLHNFAVYLRVLLHPLLVTIICNNYEKQINIVQAPASDFNTSTIT